MYEIKITKIDKEVPFIEREYKIIGEDENGKSEYGYVEFDSTKDVSTEVYTQIVENLDLSAVIQAVNKEENAKRSTANI